MLNIKINFSYINTSLMFKTTVKYYIILQMMIHKTKVNIITKIKQLLLNE